jgi:hypothetical protein
VIRRHVFVPFKSQCRVGRLRMSHIRESHSGHVIAGEVIGPDGEVITWATLPVSSTTRWVTKRKAQLIAAIRGGLITVDEACQRYRLTIDELGEWQSALDRHGARGLKVTLLQQYRFLRGVDRERSS